MLEGGIPRLTIRASWQTKRPENAKVPDKHVIIVQVIRIR